MGGFNCSQHGLEDPQEVLLKTHLPLVFPTEDVMSIVHVMLQPIAIMQAENAEASDLIGGERRESM